MIVEGKRKKRKEREGGRKNKDSSDREVAPSRTVKALLVDRPCTTISQIEPTSSVHDLQSARRERESTSALQHLDLDSTPGETLTD